MTLTARNMRRRLIRGAKKQIRRLMRAEGRDDVENRYEVYHRRGKDYADATHERENARRLKRMSHDLS